MQTFHIGYPKSGSTTIQELLKRDGGVNFLGKPYRAPEAEYHVREHLVFGDLRQLPEATVAQMRASLCTGSPVISDEILSGVGFAHGIAANSLLQILDNIAMLTGGDYVAHVVLRRPEDFIRSYYAQIIRMGGRASFEQFCSLVLLRRHRWVFRSLDFGAILRSAPYREGKLRPVLFEDLFQEKQLAPYMRETFGVTGLPDDPAALQANPSDPDVVLDLAAAHLPENPSARLHIQVTRPSIQELAWAERRPEEERNLHRRLWATELAQFNQITQLARNVMERARQVAAGNTAKRPMTPAFEALLKAIHSTNAGVAEAHPELGFARHRYFV